MIERWHSLYIHVRPLFDTLTGEWKKNDLTYYIANYDVDRSIVSITKEVIRSEIQRAIKVGISANSHTITLRWIAYSNPDSSSSPYTSLPISIPRAVVGVEISNQMSALAGI